MNGEKYLTLINDEDNAALDVFCCFSWVLERLLCALLGGYGPN